MGWGLRWASKEDDVRKPTGLPTPTIIELAVDPADVDRASYPVTLQLDRALTEPEIETLNLSHPELRMEDHARVVVPEAKLDDVAHGIHDWNSEFERIHAAAEQLEGELDLRRLALARRQAGHAKGGNINQHMH
jgi:hypothetical protein